MIHILRGKGQGRNLPFNQKKCRRIAIIQYLYPAADTGAGIAGFHQVADIVPDKYSIEGFGNKKGILRAGYFLMPMDETLAAAAIDLSGRPRCIIHAKIGAAKVGDFTVELLEDFFQGFAQSAKANVHLRCLYGRSSHHQIEALFKAFARALRFAVSRDRRLKNVLPSTKELL